MKVLIIEDDQEITEAVSLAFQIRWPEAELVSTRLGEKGIELVENEAPDIVILDLGLPDISGQEVLVKIRRINSEVNVIITSGHDFERDKKAFAELKADDYILKPFNIADLVIAVRDVLDKGKDKRAKE